MTTPRVSQFINLTLGASSSPDVRASQFAAIALVQQAPPSIKVSQFVSIALTANNKQFVSLWPVIGLGCWSPCGTLAHNYYKRN